MFCKFLKQTGFQSLFKLRILVNITSVKRNLFQIVATRNSSSQEYTIKLNEPMKLHNLQHKVERSVTLTNEQALLYYSQMYQIRKVEHAAAALYQEKIIRGFVHLYSGQEAVAVGLRASMEPDDDIITAYRCHGYALLQGISVHHLIAELAGRTSGVNRGKSGSMHMMCKHFYGGNGIVGSQVPLGTGIAFALKYKQAKNIIFTCYGDGAANQGQVYESYNIAKLWKLPIVYVCENNQFGMGTSTTRSSANPNYYTHGSPSNIPGIWVNGMSILDVREAGRFAREHVISGKGPIIIECSTYRYYGHSMSDPGTSYRKHEDIQSVRQSRDPITSFMDVILKNQIVSKEEIKRVETSINMEIDAAVNNARNNHEPLIAELAADIYADSDRIPPIRFKAPYHTLPHKRVGPAVNI